MLRRFAAAVTVASPAIALAALTALQVPDLRPEGLFRLTSLWCVVPAVWGLWAMLAPRTWVPQRLPLWGAVLGLFVTTGMIVILNLPAHVLAVELSAPQRALFVMLLTAFYYLLWMLVRAAFRALAPKSPPPVGAA